MKSTCKRIGKTACLLILMIVACPVLVAYSLMLYTLLRYRMRKKPEASCHASRRTSEIKTLAELLEGIELVSPGSTLPSPVGKTLMSISDIVPFLLGLSPATAGYMYPYPATFDPVMLESKDGTLLAGLMAVHPDAEKRPGIVVVHGLFGSKNQYLVQEIALRAHYLWGFQTLVIDLRGCGESQRLSDSPLSWGWKESEDILSAAEYLCSLPQTTTVGVLGFSLGGSASLIAASRTPATGPLRGGILAINPYADAQSIVNHLSARPGPASPFFLPWLRFRATLQMKTWRPGGPRYRDYLEYTRESATQYYEVSEKELFRRSSPVDSVAEIECPTLILHSEDDSIVEVEHAHSLATAAADNPMVKVLIRDVGDHCVYSMTQRQWYFEVLRKFFLYWAEFGWDPSLLSANFPISRQFGETDN